jgi:Xaa-Pro aminopeptidase
LVTDIGPITTLKAVKNSTEVSGFQASHRRDGAAVVSFLVWLENQPRDKEGFVLSSTGGTRLTEVTAADKLESFRRAASPEQFRCLSFSTIFGVGANGAIVHYHAQPDTCAAVHDRSLILVDSGAQYTDGTTDITRTFHLAPHRASDFEREAFTRVLKGHILLGSACFPEGTNGYQLDTLARLSLWQAGTNRRRHTASRSLCAPAA